MTVRPIDTAGWQVLADELMAAGDPRGELVAVQLKLEQGEDLALRAREAVLFDAHGPQLAGAAWYHSRRELARASRAVVTLHWRRGYLDALTLGADWPDLALDLAELWRELNQDPQVLMFLESLSVGALDTRHDFSDWTDVIAAMVETGLPAGLKHFEVDCGVTELALTHLNGLDRLYPAMSALESLRLRIGNLGLGAIELPQLKSFEVVSPAFTGQNLAEIATARWPNLESLVLNLGDPSLGASHLPGELESLLAHPPPPKLTHLALKNAAVADALPELLAGSRWLAQLRTLDLSQGTLGDEGADALLARAPRFAHLTGLDLSQSFLSETDAEQLQRAFPTVVLEKLRPPMEPDDRWVAIGDQPRTVI